MRNLSIPIEASEIEELIDADEETSPQFSEILQDEIKHALNELVDGTPNDSIAIDELSDEEQPEEILLGMKTSFYKLPRWSNNWPVVQHV